MNALRVRLFAILLVTTGALWSLAALWISVNTRDEIQAVLDSRLREAAHMVGSLIGTAEAVARLEAAGGADASALFAPVPDSFDKKLSCQVWSLSGGLVASSGSAPGKRLADHASGFGEKWIDGERWRVYVLRSPETGVEIMVGDSVERRERLVDDIMTGLYVPAVPLLLVLAGVVWLSVSRGLAPLGRLADELARRAADDLSPVRARGAPRELRPVIAALDALFERVRAARARERAFIDSAAHELRTPLAGVRTQAQVALAAGEDAARRNALARVVQAADRASRLASRLLLLSRLEADGDAGEATRGLPLDPLARRILSDLAAGGAAVDRVRLDPALADQVVDADEGLVVLALSNLLDNALAHAGADAPVAVRLADRQGRPALLVEDDGPGVPEEEVGALAERFRRGRRARGDGSGLGLSIAATAARRLGADLVLENRPEGGFRAGLVLPPGRVRTAPAADAAGRAAA